MSDKPDFAAMDDRLRAKIAELVYRTKTDPARQSHDSDVVAGRIMEWIKERDIKHAAAQASRGEGQWRPISEPPATTMGVLLYVPSAATEGFINGQDYRTQIGWWDAAQKMWCEQGTSHDCFEPWLVESGDVPTAWQPLPPPPPAPQE